MPSSPRRLAPLLALAAGCAAPHLQVAAPSSEWRRIDAADDAVAYHHPDGGTMAANATCEDAEDVPLDVLTNHLLIGIEDRKELERRRITVEGRGALRTRLAGTVDGVPVGLELVVLKKDGCIYDLMLIARRERLAALTPTFDRFVRSFEAVRP